MDLSTLAGHELPEDWQGYSVDEIATIKTGPFGTLLKASEYSRIDGVPLISVREVREGFLQVDQETPLVPHSVVRRMPEYLLRHGDIVFGRKGAVDRSALVQPSQDGWFLGSDGIRLRVMEPHDSAFVAYYFQRKEVQDWLLQQSTGTTMATLNQGVLRRVPVGLPPPEEQRAIAAALSEVDDLVAALDALIEKKRAVKTAAMQRLLTGRQRLPGFSGEWETKRLDQIGEIESSGVDKKVVQGEAEVRLVNYMDVYRRDLIYSADLGHWVTAPSSKATRCAVQKGDVFFTPSSETPDDIAHSAVAMEDISDAVYSYHVVRLRLREDWDLRFRAYAFKTKAFLDQASTVCAGSGTRYVISKAQFKALEVLVPPTSSEQRAIAEILSDMDAEVAALEARREKTRMIKQGMMQELLTGRTRLV